MSQRDSALQIKLMRENWQQLAPGIYVDEFQQMHLFADEWLAGYGFKDTPENRRQVEEELQRQLPGVPVHRIEDQTE